MLSPAAVVKKMSSSKILYSATLKQQPVPVGSDEFIQRYQKQVEENSSEGQKIRQLEQQHQIELQQTYRKGFADGENIGLNKGLSASRQVENELRQIINTLVNYQRSIYAQASDQLFNLAFALADKIVKSRGEAEKEVVLDTVKKCLHEILDKSRLTIRVNPAQADFVKQHLAEVMSSGESMGNVLVEPDQRVAGGGCVIETDSGNADARLENQLQMLHEKLLELQ